MFYYFAHMSTLGSIVSINISIFMFWIYGKRYNWRTEMFMLENFSLSVEHLKHGKFYTIITSGFSHSKLWHISLNMTAFWGISIPLIQSFGHNNYLSYYFGASALVSMVTIFRELYSKRKKISIGASGGIHSLIGTLLVMNYKVHSSFILLPLLNLKMQCLISFFIITDVCGVLKQWNFFDHLAHIAVIND